MATLEIYVNRPKQLTAEQFRLAMQDALTYIRRISPIDTGYFRATWFMYNNGDQAAFVNVASYASYLNRGSSAQAPEGIGTPLRRELPIIYGRYMRSKPDGGAPITRRRLDTAQKFLKQMPFFTHRHE